MRFFCNDEMYDPGNITSNLSSNFPRQRFLSCYICRSYIDFLHLR